MNDTPETDAKASPHIGFYSCATVPAEFSRKLERERDEAREDRDMAQRYALDSDHAYDLMVKAVDEAREELANIESLMFGGLVQFTPKDGIAWRVFYAVMELKKERDKAREDATNYYARIGELESERDELKEIVEQRILVGAEIHNKANSLIKQNDKTEAECERLRKQLTAATSALRQIHLEVGDWIRSTIIVEE